MYELSILTEFGAAHQLIDYPGKCCRLHGHNWQVEVTVRSEVLDSLGMVMDFSILKNEVARVIETIDHRFLNELSPFQQLNPTSENIAKYTYESLAVMPAFASGITVYSVKVWETPRSSVLYRP